MKTYKSTIFIAVLFLLHSCGKSHSINTISVDVYSTEVPQVIIEKEIPLETTDKGLLGSFTSFAVFNNRVFILDADNAMSLFLFDTSGRFLNRTKYGKAPMEMINPIDFFVDTTRNEVLVWDQGTHKMNFYDLELNFSSDSAIDMVLKNFVRLKNGCWLVKVDGCDYYGKSRKNYKDPFFHYFLYSSDFSSILSMQLPFIYKEFRSIYLNGPISKSTTPILCSQIDVKLYSINDEGVIDAKYQVDFGDYSIPRDISELSTEEIYAHQSKGNFVANIDRINANDRYLSFSFYFMKKKFYAIFSKQQNKTYLSSAIERSQLLPHGEICAATSDGSLVLVADAADYVAFCEAKGQPTAVKPTDNPVLVIFTIDEP